MANGLSVSRLINVDVILTPIAVPAPNFDTMLIQGDSDVIDVVTRMLEFNSIEEVAERFGTSAPEYNAALLWFAQTPQPDSLYIGRWARTATPGQLFGAPLSTSAKTISTWTAITDGGMDIAVDGGAAQQLDALNFSAVTNLNGVAAIISAAITGATCVYDALEERFVITSDTTGASSEIGFATAPTATATDISALAGLRSTSSGAYQADGIVAETPLEATVIFDNRFGSQWYATAYAAATMPTDDQILAVASYIEAANPPHILAATSQDAGCLSAASTTDLMYRAKDLSLDKTFVQYSSSNAYAAVSAFGRILTTNWNGNNTTITLMYKQEPLVVPETLSATQASTLKDKNGNVFVRYNNDTAILQYGQVSSGDYLDTIIGCDWLGASITNALYNLLYTSPTKVPQTDAGNQLLATQIENVCAAGVNNGLLAPGQWNSAGFGQLLQGAPLPKGYYIYTPPISSQSQADREARKSVTFQVAAKLAGAIHTVDVLVNVNR